MNKPYLIKNCPAFNTISEECIKDYGLCEFCTDCVMKQIVELCNDTINAEEKLMPKSGIYYFAQKILNKLEIEEVE